MRWPGCPPLTILLHLFVTALNAFLGRRPLARRPHSFFLFEVYSFVLCDTNEPLEGVNSFDVLLDMNDSARIQHPGYRHRFVGLLLYISDFSCSRSTCRHVDPSKTRFFGGIRYPITDILDFIIDSLDFDISTGIFCRPDISIILFCSLTSD